MMTVMLITSFVLVALAALLSLWRMIQGPTTPDRVVAADTFAIITTAGLVWLADWFSNPLFLDIALVYGALAFVGVVAIARIIDGGYAQTSMQHTTTIPHIQEEDA